MVQIITQKSDKRECSQGSYDANVDLNNRLATLRDPELRV
jgi:hypothetical protein